MTALPLNLTLETITSDARLILNDRDLRTHKTIKQSAFANVWSTDDDNSCKIRCHAQQFTFASSR
jgi:hypothetical protein